MTVSALLILVALWGQGVLTMVLLVVLGRRRLPLVGRGEIKVRDIALDTSPWPETAQKASNAFDNQFQLPVLFAVGAGMTIYLGAGWLEAVLAWMFVGTRIAHAFIHVTTNHVYQRFTAYMIGFAVLAVLWIVILVRIIAAFGAL